MRIAEAILVEIKQMQTQPVLYFAFAQIVQVWLPVAVFGQIVGHMPGQKNVPSIAAIHYPLSNIDSRSCKVCFVVYIPDPIDRATVNSHPHLNMRMLLQDPADLERTS